MCKSFVHKHSNIFFLSTRCVLWSHHHIICMYVWSYSKQYNRCMSIGNCDDTMQFLRFSFRIDPKMFTPPCSSCSKLASTKKNWFKFVMMHIHSVQIVWAINGFTERWPSDRVATIVEAGYTIKIKYTHGIYTSIYIFTVSPVDKISSSLCLTQGTYCCRVSIIEIMSWCFVSFLRSIPNILYRTGT